MKFADNNPFKAEPIKPLPPLGGDDSSSKPVQPQSAYSQNLAKPPDPVPAQQAAPRPAPAQSAQQQNLQRYVQPQGAAPHQWNPWANVVQQGWQQPQQPMYYPQQQMYYPQQQMDPLTAYHVHKQIYGPPPTPQSAQYGWGNLAADAGGFAASAYADPRSDFMPSSYMPYDAGSGQYSGTMFSPLSTGVALTSPAMQQAAAYFAPEATKQLGQAVASSPVASTLVNQVSPMQNLWRSGAYALGKGPAPITFGSGGAAAGGGSAAGTAAAGAATSLGAIYGGHVLTDTVATGLNMGMHGEGKAQNDGIVSRIEPAPGGGNYVYVNEEPHYVQPGYNLRVNLGDQVNAGTTLSEGKMRLGEHEIAQQDKSYLSQFGHNFMNPGQAVRSTVYDDRGGAPGAAQLGVMVAKRMMGEKPNLAAMQQELRGEQVYGADPRSQLQEENQAKIDAARAAANGDPSKLERIRNQEMYDEAVAQERLLRYLSENPEAAVKMDRQELLNKYDPNAHISPQALSRLMPEHLSEAFDPSQNLSDEDRAALRDRWQQAWNRRMNQQIGLKFDL